MSAVGGASGMLYGNFFLRAATVVPGKRELTASELLAALQAGLHGIVHARPRGRGRQDDGRCLDAGARLAWRGRLRRRRLPVRLHACVISAKEGMNSTIPWLPRRGAPATWVNGAPVTWTPARLRLRLYCVPYARPSIRKIHHHDWNRHCFAQRPLAQGVVDIVEQMVQGRVPLATAGGTDIAEAPIGTNPFKVLAAIDSVYNEQGCLVLMDLGSALMSAEAALDMLPDERKMHVVLCEAPLVEGAVAAAVRAMTGGTLQEVLDDARAAYASKTAQLTSLLHLPATKTVAQQAAVAAASAARRGIQSGTAVDDCHTQSFGFARPTCRSPGEPGCSI